jgi:hypothetical protein
MNRSKTKGERHNESQKKNFGGKWGEDFSFLCDTHQKKKKQKKRDKFSG